MRVRDRLRSLQGVEAEQQLWKVETEFARLTNQLNNLTSKLGFYGFSEEIIQRIKKHDIDSMNSIEVLQSLPIRSPIDGWITQVNAVVGQAVRPDQSLVEIQDPSNVWVRGFAFEKEAKSVAVGQSASISVPYDPVLTSTGVIERMSPTATGAARATSVWVPIKNSELRLKPGMSVLLTVTSPKATTPQANDNK